MGYEAFGSVALAAVAIIGLIGAWIGGALKVSNRIRDIEHRNDSQETAITDLGHDVRNQRSRIDALEHLRTADVERIVRLETSYANIDKSLDRIERQQSDNFDALSQSIREIRVVEKKG